jgi:serine/threonine-protein kinase
MAAVFKAYDPHFQRDVALKILPREFLHDPTFRTRFAREAQTIAALDHPAIVPVYDFGEEAGQPYLVMRYLPGGSLTDRLKQGPLFFAETVRIITRLAPALDEAHKLGVIHRDLKPDNILFDHRNEPFMTDFGIAKLSEERGSLTTGGLIIGTPGYMSPEQANGDELDGRSDIYSLGIIIFEMLTGKLPYTANTPIGLIMQHITQPIPNILEINPDLPPTCESIIAQAIAKEPDKRYATATALATALAEAPHATQHQTETVVAQPSKLKTIKLEEKRTSPQPAQDELLVCPQCGIANTDQARFCANCNARLRIDCPLCYTSNRIDAAACINCGADLKSLRLRQAGVQQLRKSSLAKRDHAYKEKASRQLREKLQGLFKDLESRRKRDAALRQLSQLVNSAAKLLAEDVLIDHDPEARYNSAMLLGKLCSMPEMDSTVKTQVAETLTEALNDSDPRVQERVQYELDKLSGRRTREISDIFKGFVGWLKGEE